MGGNKKTPVMRKANQKVRDDVRRGNRTKPSNCSNCGKKTAKNLLASHHSNHKNKSSIKWLCPKCHKGAEKRKPGGKVN